MGYCEVLGPWGAAPWKAVFEAKDWDALLTRSILPKLQFALGELVINPAAQVLEPLQWVLAWEPCVPPHRIVALLEAGFFPKWQAPRGPGPGARGPGPAGGMGAHTTPPHTSLVPPRFPHST